MAGSTTLYAWVHPLSVDKDLDHTWVTDYAPPPVYATIGDVVSAGGHYWYCWGSYHPAGVSSTYPGGAIGNAPGNLQQSSCIAAPNDSSAHGSIFRYAINGVCHQLANQVLYSTDGPLTVSKARGYWLSSFLYDTYGRPDSDWQKLKNSCMGTGGSSVDDFEDHVRKMLGDAATPEKLAALAAQRDEFQKFIDGTAMEAHAENAEEAAGGINSSVSRALMMAAEILGPDDFEKVFGTKIKESFSLIDPEQFAISEAAHKDSR